MEKERLMQDLAWLAFETDSTRVVALLLDRVNLPAFNGTASTRDLDLFARGDRLRDRTDIRFQVAGIGAIAFFWRHFAGAHAIVDLGPRFERLSCVGPKGRSALLGDVVVAVCAMCLNEVGYWRGHRCRRSDADAGEDRHRDTKINWFQDHRRKGGAGVGRGTVKPLKR
jgi:hypothetical protein